MLHTLVDAGEADLLAVVGWRTQEYAVAAIDAFNPWCRHPDIRIAGRKDAAHHEYRAYSRAVAEAVGGDLRTCRDAHTHA